MTSQVRFSNKRWMWLRAAVIALTLLLTMLFLNAPLVPHSAQAAPSLQDLNDLCAIHPPEMQVDTEPLSNPTKGCAIKYLVADKQSYMGWTDIYQFKSSTEAREWVSQYSEATVGDLRRPTTAYGDSGFEVREGTEITSGGAKTNFNLWFSRGCFGVWVLGIEYDGVTGGAAAMRQIASQVDQQLKTLPPCPDAAVQPQPPAVAGPFSVGFVCGYNEPQYAPGQVSCAASTTNAPPDAEIEYKWFMDGVQQPETGNTFARDDQGIAPGEHSITVYAVDTRTNIQSEGASYRFTKPGTPAAQPPAAQPPAAPSAGQVVVKTSSGTTTVNPGEKTQITLRPGDKAEIRAKCEKLQTTIGLMSLTRDEGKYLEDSDLYYVFLLIKIKCSELLSSEPRTLAMAGQPDGALLPLLSTADKPVQLKLELQQGPLRAEVVHDSVSLEVETATTTVTSVGKNTVGVAHDPNTGASIVSAYQGTVSIQPKNLALAPTTLETGQRVEVTQSNIGAVTTISAPGSTTTGALALLLCGGVPFLMLAALIGGVVVFRRSRSRRARPSPPPPSGIPERGQRPSGLPEHGVQPGLSATCPHCKSPVRAGAKFCSQCGKRIA